MRNRKFGWWVLLPLFMLSCSSLKKNNQLKPAFSKNGNSQIQLFFNALPNHELDLKIETPRQSYPKDPAEKDIIYSHDSETMKFTKLAISLFPHQEKNKVLVDFSFTDYDGNIFKIHSVDLLDLVPNVSQKGEMRYGEYLLQEYERFGILYYKKENAFTWDEAEKNKPQITDAINRSYQAGIFNNCLDAGKWELVLSSKYFNHFDSTHAFFNQAQRYRVLVHSWFTMDSNLYRVLLKIKNPNFDIDPYISYDTLTKWAENQIVPFPKLTKIKRTIETKVIEIGYQSRRELFELDDEEMYKDWYSLVLNRDKFHTYKDVLETPVRMAKFTDKGFYRTSDPIVFDYGWMKSLNQVELKVVDASGPERFIQLTLSGELSQYNIVLGNFDLGRLNPNKTATIQFGINPFPKLRLQRKTNYSTGYNLGPDGKEIRPFLVLIDKKTGKWVNNQKLGLEQMFIEWQSIDKQALLIHLVTYERMLPVWMALVGVDEIEREKGQISNAKFQSGDSVSYLYTISPIARKQRESLRSDFLGKKENQDSVVLDFESLSHKDDKLAQHGFFYDEKGFTLLSGGLLAAEPFRSVGEKGFPFSGSTSLINGQSNGVNYLMKRDELVNNVLNVDDNLFGVISVDMARFNTISESKITFVGVKRDSSTVSQSFDLNENYVPKTFVFGPDFREIATLRWISHSTMFDNIRLKRNPKI